MPTLDLPVKNKKLPHYIINHIVAGYGKTRVFGNVRILWTAVEKSNLSPSQRKIHGLTALNDFLKNHPQALATKGDRGSTVFMAQPAHMWTIQ